MPLAEERALEILAELIKKPESRSEDIPRIWNEILEVYNRSYAPPAEVPAKKRRRRSANPNIGWPAGVSRADYYAWKKSQEATGVTEKLNPQEFKRLREAGLVSAAEPNSEARVITAKPKKAKADSSSQRAMATNARSNGNGRSEKKIKTGTK